jgi:hypothetical protein
MLLKAKVYFSYVVLGIRDLVSWFSRLDAAMIAFFASGMKKGSGSAEWARLKEQEEKLAAKREAARDAEEAARYAARPDVQALLAKVTDIGGVGNAVV